MKRPLAGCLGCAGALALLVLAAYEAEPFERLDATILSRLSSYRESALGSVANLIAHLGDPLPQLVLLALVCLLALHWRKRREAVAAAVLIAGANLTTQVLKAVLAHPRFQPVLGYSQVGAEAFPSGHATATMSIVLAFGLVVPPSWRAATAMIGACLVAAVGCSVVILHHHYPSDVLGGLLVATVWFFAVLAYSAANSSVCQLGSSGRS